MGRGAQKNNGQKLGVASIGPGFSCGYMKLNQHLSVILARDVPVGSAERASRPKSRPSSQTAQVCPRSGAMRVMMVARW